MSGRNLLRMWKTSKQGDSRRFMQPLGAPRHAWCWGISLLIAWALLWINGGMAASTALAQGEQPTATTPAEQSGTDAVTAESVQVRRVKVNFFINSIHTIDDESGKYAIDFWLDLFWRDPALEGKTVDDVDPARLWNPQVEAINSTDLTVLYQSYADSFEPDTNVYLSQRLVGTFTNGFDLRRFPFDRQWLVIALESSDFDSNRLLFDFMDANQAIIYSEKPFTFPLPIGKYISTEFALGEWSLTEANVVQQIHVLPYDKSTWAQLRIELQLQRHSQPYVLKIMLVFVFIMGLGATVFAIKLSELRYRLLAFFMLLLTAVTFDFTRLQRSPRTAYLTLLDLQALLCYFLLGIAILAVVLIALRNKSGAAAQAERLNRWVTVGYGITIVLINLGLSWYGWRG